MTLQEILADIHALEEDLLDFERKYGVRSETFYAAYISGEELANSLKEIRVVNVLLLGALAALLERDSLCVPELRTEIWLKVITNRVPEKHIELNQNAFKLGQAAVNNADIKGYNHSN